MHPIPFDDTRSTNEAWKRILEPQLRQAASFEIHCWTEETKEIAAALHFGQRKETDWPWGTVIAGAVTPAFIDLERCVRALPRQVVIHRLTGDGAKRDLLAPLWSGDKKRVMNAIHAAFLRDDVEQGSDALPMPEQELHL